MGNQNAISYKEVFNPIDPGGLIVTGQAAIVQEHVDLLSGPFKDTGISGKVRRVQTLGRNYMIVDFDLRLSGMRQLPSGTAPSASGVLCSHLKHILEERLGIWKVLSAQNTFAPC